MSHKTQRRMDLAMVSLVAVMRRVPLMAAGVYGCMFFGYLGNRQLWLTGASLLCLAFLTGALGEIVARMEALDEEQD